jgi:hypothetical protein
VKHRLEAHVAAPSKGNNQSYTNDKSTAFNNSTIEQKMTSGTFFSTLFYLSRVKKYSGVSKLASWLLFFQKIQFV